MSLANTTFGLFNNAAGNAGQMYNSGLGMLGQSADWMKQAASGMGGFGSGATSLANTNLSSYMNPFQQDVINNTMGELNRQETMQRNGIADRAQQAGAFGGDRQAVEYAENNRNFDATRAQTLGNLNMQNFNNAQGQANNDLNRMQQGFTGLGSLGQSWGSMGQNQQQFGQGQMGGLADQGFGMGQTLQNNQLQMGGMQQNQLQNILNNIMGQTNAWQNYGDTGLQRYFGATQNPGGYGTSNTTGTVSGSTQQGIGGILGSIGSIVGAFI
jgi:hypothetical protein